MKTKIFCLLLAMVAVMACLASCSFGGGGDDDPYEGTGLYDVDWKKTELIYEMSENSNSGQLTSTTRRYYAGDAKGQNTLIDQKVKTRNNNALKEAYVVVTYKYLADNKTYGWGASIQRMTDETKTYGTGSTDIYCNFAYDMTCASVMGAFANLKSDRLGDNFFAFNEPGYTVDSSNYFDANSGQGYFYNYMQSLSLSNDKMYCLASNYCTDLVRAFLVVPVNISLINEIEDDKLPGANTSDGLGVAAKQPGQTNIQHFYDSVVWENKWTYDVLAHYSNSVFDNTDANKYDNEHGSANIGDTLGFAVGLDGLVGSGLLYTSSVKILEKNGNSYQYPTTNADLDALATALKELIVDNANNGIAIVSDNAANSYKQTTVGDAIRQEFASKKVLFGGIIALGSLEDAVYQNMRAGEGFGIAPVPLYKDYVAGSNEYQTLVHNIAKIVGIASKTQKFSQATAYLDYVSTNSTEILTQYYDVELSAKVQGVASEDNTRMLNYVRSHVRDCFDKTYEDIIGNYMAGYDNDSFNNKFHYILENNLYNVTSMNADYTAYRNNKQQNLEQTLDQWNTLQ